jgi:hypothetical protein
MSEVSFIEREFPIIGKTIANVVKLTAEEIDEMGWQAGWDDVAMAIEFTDGSWIIPSRDPEGNGPGFLIYSGPLSEM